MTRRSADLRLDSLLRTACDVIAERGLANTRTSDVAAAAGVSQALIFYHFATKERLVAQAFAHAAEQDLARLDTVVRSALAPVEKLRSVLRLLLPTGRGNRWALWIDAWAGSLRSSELEAVARRLDLRWKAALADVIAAAADEGAVKCDDPRGAAWRITALIDGLAVRVTVHGRVVSRRQMADWVWLATARELGLDPDHLHGSR